MEKRELQRIALEWIVQGDHAPVPRIWQERIAALCADFTEMMCRELMYREGAMRKLADDCLMVRPVQPIIIYPKDKP